jgi:hypothetical protein
MPRRSVARCSSVAWSRRFGTRLLAIRIAPRDVDRDQRIFNHSPKAQIDPMFQQLN